MRRLVPLGAISFAITGTGPSDDLNCARGPRTYVLPRALDIAMK